MSETEEVTLEIQAPENKRRKDKIKEAMARDDDAMIHTMLNKEGRRTVWRIFETTGFFQTSFTGNSETFFREGKRDIGRRLYEELNRVCPDLYIQMMNENKPKKEASNG